MKEKGWWSLCNFLTRTVSKTPDHIFLLSSFKYSTCFSISQISFCCLQNRYPKTNLKILLLVPDNNTEGRLQ